MRRTWTYRSPDAIGQPKRHADRCPSTAKESDANRALSAIFAMRRFKALGATGDGQ